MKQSYFMNLTINTKTVFTLFLSLIFIGSSNLLSAQPKKIILTKSDHKDPTHHVVVPYSIDCYSVPAVDAVEIHSGDPMYNVQVIMSMRNASSSIFLQTFNFSMLSAGVSSLMYSLPSTILGGNYTLDVSLSFMSQKGRLRMVEAQFPLMICDN